MTRRLWSICALAVIGASWAICLGAQPAPTSLIEVRVRGVTVDPQGGSPVVLLEALPAARVLPIWVGVFEARAIAMALEKVVPPRPMTHDLIKNLLNDMQAHVTSVMITDLKDNTFYAQIAVSDGDRRLQIDARPSDAIALALRLEAPIYVTPTVFDNAPAVDLHVHETTPMTVLKRYGLTLQDLTASLAEHFHLDTPEGVLVSDVEAGSGAERDGMRRGDIVVAVNQDKIPNLNTFEAVLKQTGNIALQIVRADKRLTILLRKPAP
jgi:bifunctional DNase/RNase